jgi:predicted DNA-binding transcriptional regulator YafY
MNDIKRLSRITAILTQLQAKRLTTASRLAEKFRVTTRTIYRDIRTLEEAGVPIIAEEGKGYSLMDGYRIPPVMFTENEANALITAELLIQACKDESLIKEFSSAIQKIKAVVPNYLKERTEVLEEKLAITKIYTDTGKKSKYLLSVQKALLEHRVLAIEYTNLSNISSVRELEPFAIYNNEKDEWGLIAYCRLRKKFRSFLLNRIGNLTLTDKKFNPHALTFAQYRKKVYGD